MAFSNGVFNRIFNWVQDKNNSINITASRMDSEMNGMATGLSTCMLKDGTQTITANIPMASHKFTGLVDGTAATDSATVGQSQSGTLSFVATVGGTANAITIVSSPVTTSLVAGRIWRIIVGTTNTGAVTLAENGLAATAIKKSIGGALVALVAGDLVATTVADILYDGTQYQLLNPFAHSHGADIASASTIVLDTATGDIVDVTGTVTITAITLAEGRECTVRFTGVLTLTNGASLLLPGAANITTAAGDYAIFRGYASGVVRCVLYSPLSGNILTNGTWTPGITFATVGNLNVVYSAQVGRYQRTGNLVKASFTIVTSTFTFTTASGDLRITGFPFTMAGATVDAGAVFVQGYTKANFTQTTVTPVGSQTFANITVSGSGQSQATMKAADMPTGGTVIINGTLIYEV